MIPIIHTEADMGTLAATIRHAAAEKIGRRKWERSVDVIGRMWARIRNSVTAWELPWERVRLYQDGLPRCGRESEIVKELAQAGSPNHQLLLELMEKGASLMGTESPELLVEEYRLVQQVFAAKSPEDAAKVQAQHAAKSRSLLTRRDRYVATRINESLCPGETGMLFVGMLHSIEPNLAADMRVSYPIFRPSRSGKRTLQSRKRTR